MRYTRHVALALALVFFVYQVTLAHRDGAAVGGIVGTLAAVLLAIVVALVVVLRLMRRAQRRRIGTLVAGRPGWEGVAVVIPRPAGSTGPSVAATLVFGPQGVELWSGSKAPFTHVVGGPWGQVAAEAAPVRDARGRAVAKAGLRLQVAGQPPQQLVVAPERSFRSAFPAPTAAASVVAALGAAHAVPTHDARGRELDNA